MKNPWLLSLAPLHLLLAVSSSLPLTAARLTRVRSVLLGSAGQSAMIRVRSVPLAGQSAVECYGDGVYAANSTYQANLRRLAALLIAEASANPGKSYSYTARAVGYWPNRLLGSSFCLRRNKTGDGGDPCAHCIAGAFREVERACPFRREASFSDGNCSLEFEESRVFGTGGIFRGDILRQVMASGLVFQAIGFACLFFMQFQEWRSRKRGSLMNSTPLLSGD